MSEIENNPDIYEVPLLVKDWS